MVTVRYFASAAEAVGLQSEVVDYSSLASSRGPGTIGTIAGLRDFLGEKHPQLRNVLRQSRFAINQRFVVDSDAVADDVEVAVIPPVAGG